MALVLCTAALALPALAEADGLSVRLDAGITLEGTLPDPAEIYTIRLTADDPASPMPGGQTGGSYDLEITGAGTASFSAIAYDRLGIYTYSLAQVPGTNPDCTYDARTYSLTVSVVNAESGGLAVEVALARGRKGRKDRHGGVPQRLQGDRPHARADDRTRRHHAHRRQRPLDVLSERQRPHCWSPRRSSSRSLCRRDARRDDAE